MMARGLRERWGDQINHWPTDNWTSYTQGIVAATRKVTPWFAINCKRRNGDLVPFGLILSIWYLTRWLLQWICWGFMTHYLYLTNGIPSLRGKFSSVTTKSVGGQSVQPSDDSFFFSCTLHHDAMDKQRLRTCTCMLNNWQLWLQRQYFEKLIHFDNCNIKIFM